MIKEYFFNPSILFPMFVIYLISFLFYLKTPYNKQKSIFIGEYAQMLCSLFSLFIFFKGIILGDYSPITLKSVIMSYSFYSFLGINVISLVILNIIVIITRLRIILQKKEV